MTVRAFVDTNILLYAISTDLEETRKKERARAILADADWGLSVQVLQEFYVNATRAPAPALTHADAVSVIEALLRRPTISTDPGLVREALNLKARHRLNYWDAAIIAAARQLGASVLYSEDLNDGQDFDGVQVVNPFVIQGNGH